MTFQRPTLVGLVPRARIWPAVWLLYGAGLMAAAQLGKLSALAPVITPALGLSLAGAAWAVSLIEVGGATFGAVAGVVAQRCGLWRTLKWGLAALGLAGLGSASAASAGGLMAWRVLEAAGYLGITVSAPVLIARLTAAAGPRTQALAMSLWSTFVPAGLAFGASAAAAAAVPLGWRGALLAGGLLATALALVVAWRGTRDEEHAPTPASPPLPPPARVGAAAWCLALSFGLFALFAVGVIGLLPTLLVQGAGLTPAAAGQWTGLASLSAVLGSALGAVLLRRHWPARWPGLLALALPAVLAWGVFAARPDATWAVVLAVAINVLGGVFASLAFAALPRVVVDAGQLVRANGLLTQFGASGSLLGPPVMAAGVGAWDWPGAAAVGAAVSVLALPLAWRALRGV